jgi:hypothetical protein
MPVAATKLVGQRQVEFRQSRAIVPTLRAGVAVLYSVVNGAVREFWVKTATADVKVHEIPATTSITYTPSTDFTTGEVTVGGSLTGNPITNSMGTARVRAKYGSITIACQLTARVLNTVTLTGTVTTTSEFFGGATVTDSADPVNDPTLLNVSRTFSGGCFELSIATVSWDGPDDRGGTGGIRSTGSSSDVVITVTPENGPVDVEYEAWISAIPGATNVIVKNATALIDCFEISSPANVALFVSGESETWRASQEVAVLLPDLPPSGDACIDALRSSTSINLFEGQVYGIDLEQSIDGSSLRNRLQSSADTVTATLTTQTVTSGVSCTLGTATESTVQVPSPGRGTVEGITYLP